jgi:uncharacterized protein (DUF608 family)
MYAKHYKSAPEAAGALAREHGNLLRRILAWQEVVYCDRSLPVWLRESLVNNLYMISECGLWAQATGPVPSWVKPDDGLFAMNESPRSCPQIECIPCSFYGSLPLVYFFPELALSTLRAYKGYQGNSGQAPWVFGQNADVAAHDDNYHRQITLNDLCYAAMVDRYNLCWGDEAFVREFYDSVKRSTLHMVNLRPEYDVAEGIISMASSKYQKKYWNMSEHWFEAPKPGWFGMVPHVGGLHLAQLRIAQRMARQAGDKQFAEQCGQWIDAASKVLEEKTWLGSYYLLFSEPESGKHSDWVFGYQLDGQWVADFHGLPGVFQPERVQKTLETITRCNVALSRTGATNYARADGSPVQVGGYGTYSYFPPQVLMLAMTYMYNGQREFGLDLARRCWENIICTYGYTWDLPNIMRGDKDTGQRVWGTDYYQDMMLWSLPAAMAGQTLDAPARPGGLVDRVRRAAQRND